MLQDTFAALRCPSCGSPMPPTSMGSSFVDDGTHTEHHSCACGCRFRVEAAVERP